VLTEKSAVFCIAERLIEGDGKAMCIRALDYCPPVNITFGDYLRAVITAETNLNPEDEFGYSTALIESCRQWGIYPAGIRSMSKEALIWPSGTEGTGAARR
jgi:hypothetical protein